MIPPEFIDEVLARTDLVEIVESRVALKRSGQNYSGLCPFHNEKTPSFTVSQTKQFYYCFGCRASGSALKFLMEYDRVDFVTAVEQLAGRLGMEVPRSQTGDKEQARRRKDLYAILQQAAGFYKEQLKQHPEREKAVAYLKQRGLTGEIARDFGLGFSPPGWDHLVKALSHSNHERQLLLEAGLVAESSDGARLYDLFRDRVIFPIRDLRGRAIAFGARVLQEDDKPKYLNSPETAVFHKGRELYGLYEAKKRLRQLDRLLVVEGYMDVVALAQHGIGYAVATLGTATSQDQVERLFRSAPQVVFCFDGDAAGRGAAWKALSATLPAMQDGCSARFLFLPDGQDPDSLIRQEGQAPFEQRLAESVPLEEFFFASLAADLDMSTMEGKAALAKQAAPYIQEIPEGVFRQLLIEALSARTGLATDRLQALTGLNQAKPAAPSPPNQRTARVADRRSWAGISGLIDKAIYLLLHYPEVMAGVADPVLERLGTGPRWQLLHELMVTVSGQANISPALLLSYYRETDHFQYLAGLAEREAVLDAASATEEFTAALNKILKRADREIEQQVADELTQVALSELTESQRNLLKSITKRERSEG